MSRRFYIVNDTMELGRKEYEDFLIDYIKENEIHDPTLLIGGTVERTVRHHPLRVGRHLGFRVETFEAEDVSACERESLEFCGQWW